MNIRANLVATAGAQLVGGPWYSPLLFAKVWMREAGMTMEAIKANPSKMPFVVAILSALVLAVSLALIHAALAAESAWGASGNGLGLATGIGVAGACGAPHYAFTGRSRTLFLIGYGHSLPWYVVTSLIIALWR